jgi:CubicO group peptidase (beta-lactamase class C family)
MREKSVFGLRTSILNNNEGKMVIGKKLTGKITATLMLFIQLIISVPASAQENTSITFSNAIPGSSRLLQKEIRDLYAEGLTLIMNKGNIIPLKNLDRIRIATVMINRDSITPFTKMIAKYLPADNYCITSKKENSLFNLAESLKNYDIIINGIYTSPYPGQDGIFSLHETDSVLAVINGIGLSISVLFDHPFNLNELRNIKESEALLIAYNHGLYCEELCAQLLFGGIGARGKLPVTINEEWISGYGIETTGNIRLQYGYPENRGISSDLLNTAIDSIVNEGLEAKAYPGCEVMVARDGMVIFSKCYGYHSYDSTRKVCESDLFDLASVTKVSSTLAGLMLLDSEDKFSTDQTLGHYLSYYRRSNKDKLKMIDILTHQAGLTAWIPFWKNTTDSKGNLRKRIYQNTISEKYPFQVADSLYIRKNYNNKIFREIKRSPIGEKKYLYSDLAFIMSTGIISSLTGEEWYDNVTKRIYHKLGAYDIGFNPIKKYPPERIIPTEYDSLFRKQQIHGFVHDEGAAMLNGISGHAGLFATAGDLIKLMEMYRRMGSYGGEQIIDSMVLKSYTQYQFPENDNRRGIGFDKPSLHTDSLATEKIYPTYGASSSSFGHSGFTGTWVWIDPEYDLTYIFLSNRVNPTRNNNLLSELNIRTRILQAIYDSIGSTAADVSETE